MQRIAIAQIALQDPSIRDEVKRELQEKVQSDERLMEAFKSPIPLLDAEVEQHRAAIAALQGEPFCVAIVTIKMVAMSTQCLRSSSSESLLLLAALPKSLHLQRSDEDP